MLLDKLIQRCKLNRPQNACSLCSQFLEDMEDDNFNVTPITPTKNPEIKKRKKLPRKKHLLELEQLFHDNQNLVPHKEEMPEQLLNYTVCTRPDYMYLISPTIAQKVANYILPNIKGTKQVVAETNAGFGYIAQELSKRGVSHVRLYEHNTAFRQILEKMYEKKFQIFNKNFFKIYMESHIDRYDQGSRVASLMEGVPKKSWVDDPVMTVVGTLRDLTFIRYLIKSIVLQREIVTYGRTDVFALMFPIDWFTLSATKDDAPHRYRPWTVLFQVFFEFKLLDKFPRKLFLPWTAKTSSRKIQSFYKYDPDNVYLVEIKMKKDFSLNAEQFVPFFCFIKTFLGSGNKTIIPTCEQWVPDCGINLIVPKLNHDDYFEDIDIFTKFKELNPQQIVAVFKEIASLPGYSHSPFSAMVEQELIKSETINSEQHATHKYRKKSAVSDFELK